MNTQIEELARREGHVNPTWAMALLYPDQGHWTVEDFLRLDIGRHVEFSNGSLEFQPMPDEKHQAMLFFLIQALKAYAGPRGARAHMAPLPVRLWDSKFREPDAVYMRAENLARCQGKFWDGADVALEILSSANRAHDLETKRAEYAQAGIPEYWIVDPEKEVVTVLRLQGQAYLEHGLFTRGQTAASALLPGFSANVADLFDAE